MFIALYCSMSTQYDVFIEKKLPSINGYLINPEMTKYRKSYRQ